MFLASSLLMQQVGAVPANATPQGSGAAAVPTGLNVTAAAAAAQSVPSAAAAQPANESATAAKPSKNSVSPKGSEPKHVMVSITTRSCELKKILTPCQELLANRHLHLGL